MLTNKLTDEDLISFYKETIKVYRNEITNICDLILSNVEAQREFVDEWLDGQIDEMHKDVYVISQAISAIRDLTKRCNNGNCNCNNG